MHEYIDAKGRGTILQPGNRFEQHSVELDPAAFEEIAAVDEDFQPSRPETQHIADDTQSIITQNQSPDLGFSHSLNPYRGCEHGCSYCYARPYHEYLGYNAGLDFETKLMVKHRAPELLARELSKKSWQPTCLVCSGVTDCYQPIEREYQLTRQCLEVLRDFRNPVGIVTKNALVTRDIDILSDLSHFDASVVAISLTSLDSDLAGQLEPRASRPAARLAAIEKLSAAGVPVGISVAPIIPGINDHEIPAILEAAKERGASFARYTVLRLPYGVKDVFEDWLERHFPERKDLVLGRIREMRGGKLNDSSYRTRMGGQGIIADQIGTMFRVTRHRLGYEGSARTLDSSHFRRCIPGQMEFGF